MRLHEITKPDPEHAELARRAEDVYRRLYAEAFDALRRFPPRGGEFRPDRRAVVFSLAELLGQRETQPDTRPEYERVAAVLGRLGWSTTPDLYRQGTAVREEEYVVPDTPRVRRTGGTPGAKIRRTRRMSIARILDQAMRDPEALRNAGLRRDEVEAAKKAFENDPARRGTATERRGDEPVVVVSFDPMEAAHMTAGRSWQSCWRIGGAQESRFRQALRCGIATAWLTTRGDLEGGRWLDDPTARWLVVPYLDPRTGTAVALRPVLDRYHTYGSPPSDAGHAITEALSRIEDSLNRAFGIRLGKIAAMDVEGGLGKVVLPLPAGHPARTLYFLLTERPEYWVAEIDAAAIGRLRAEKADVLTAQLRSLALEPETVRQLHAALTGRARPRDLRVANAILALAAFGVAPRRSVPPPEAFGERLCQILHVVQGMDGPDPDAAIRRLWHDEDAKIAAIVAGVGGCALEIGGDLLPGREEALRLIDRVLAHASGDFRRKVERLRELLREGRVVVASGGRGGAESLALRIVLAERDPRDIDAREAVLAPEEVLRSFPQGLRPEVELTARVVRALDEAVRGIGRPAAVLADLMRRHGRDAVIGAIRFAHETISRLGVSPRWRWMASGIFDLLHPEPGMRRVNSWTAALFALDAGLIDVSDILAAAGERSMAAFGRLDVPGGEDGEDRLLPLRMASVLAGGQDSESALAFLTGLDRREILDALETVAETASRDVAEAARGVLAIVRGEGKPQPGSRTAKVAAYLAVAGLLDPERLAGALTPRNWSDLAHALARLRGPFRDRLLDILARSKPPAYAIAELSQSDQAALARRMARHGTPVPWDDRNPWQWTMPWQLLPFTAAYAAAGGRLPDDLGVPELAVLPKAAEVVGGYDRPPVSDWLRKHARAVADAIEREGEEAADRLATEIEHGLIPEPVYRALLAQLPPEAARIVRARVEQKA